MNIRQIGLLLPTSTIFPIGKEFEKGFKTGLGDVANEVEIIKEFIGQGNTKQTEDAINKLFNYDDADIITGILSGIVTEHVAPKFLNKKRPLLVSELGEYLPNPSALNEYIFINSRHMWQHAWTIGNWAVKNISKKGMFIGGVYDAAYSFSHMFYEGMMGADLAAEWSFSIPPMPPAGQLSDMSIIFPFLEKYKPDFVFAAFCGTEATLFLNEFIKRGWHKKTQLFGLPFLLAPFAPLEDDINIYTTLPDTALPAMEAKDTFYQLGIKAGNTIAENAKGPATIYENLSASPETLLIGSTNYIFNNNDEEIITIAENRIRANSIEVEQKIIATANTFSLKNEKLGSLKGELLAGWQNPYLCI